MIITIIMIFIIFIVIVVNEIKLYTREGNKKEINKLRLRINRQKTKIMILR